MTTGDGNSDRSAPGGPYQADPVDLHVGDRLRLKRRLTGVTQDDLANAIGVSAQQLRKYESGQNRVSAASLYRIAAQLGVPMAYFFEGFEDDDDDDGKDTRRLKHAASNTFLSGSETEFLEELARLRSARVKGDLLQLVKAIRRSESQN